MRGVTRISIEAASTFNSKHHITNCTRSTNRRTCPHPSSAAACLDPSCMQPLYLTGRSDVNPVTHEGKRRIKPRASKAVVGPRGIKTEATKLHLTFLLPTRSQRLYPAKLRPHPKPRVRMRTTNYNSTRHCSRIESLESGSAKASSSQVAALNPKPPKT